MNVRTFSYLLIAQLIFALPGFSQTLTKEFLAATEETYLGEYKRVAQQPNSPGPGSLTVEQRAAHSDALARSAVTADRDALHFFMKAEAVAPQFDPRDTASAYGLILLEDSVAIVVPGLSQATQGVARIRLYANSSTNVAGHPDVKSSDVQIEIKNFLNGITFWALHTLGAEASPLPNGSIDIDMPAKLTAPGETPELNYLRLTGVADANALGAADFSSRASSFLSLKWGGIISLRLDDGTALNDFEATGLDGADYRRIRPNGAENLPPLILAQPASVTVSIGSEATMSATIAGGAGMQYQWFRGNPGQTVEGQIQPTLRLATVSYADADDYYLVATSSAGQVTTQTARLTVTRAAPAIRIGTYAGIEIQGETGDHFSIEYATEPTAAQWTLLREVTLSGSQQVFFDTSVITSQERRFYRAVLLP